MGILFTRRDAARCIPAKIGLDAGVPQRRISALYDRIAPMYDLWGNLAESQARKRALELANIKDGEDILEVAVGTGVAFYEIVKRNPNGTNAGVDLSPGMLERAKKRLETLSAANFSLALGTAFDLNLKDESIDLLINSYMFDLIPFADMNDILREFKRVLKKKARLVLVNMTPGEGFGGRLYGAIYRISPKMLGGCRGVEMAAKLQTNGFKVEVREVLQQMGFASEVILAGK